MRRVFLYSTDGCHLCEQAIGMFYFAKQQGMFDMECRLEVVDILDEPELTERYKLTIPVLANHKQQELNWPFELEQLVSWVNQS